MNKYRLEFVLFIINAIYMIIELIASRILSPYFGSTNLVWTSIIGIILLGSSIGNYIGGKMADNGVVVDKLKNILKISGILILIIPLIQKNILDIISKNVNSIEFGVTISAVLLFFLPTLLFGCFSPMIFTLKTEGKEKIGIVSGRIYALATIGSLFGTFVGGFFLLPNFGSNQLLFVLSIIVFFLILLVGKLNFKKDIVFVGIFIFFNIILLIYYSSTHYLKIDNVLNKIDNSSISYDTQYNHVTIKNINGAKYKRIMFFGNDVESITFTDSKYYNDIASNYISYYNLMFEIDNNIEETLMIGGGGYSYPKYYISTFLDKKMDVVEIDNEVTKLAKKYFFLDKLMENFDSNGERLKIIAQDGRVYLNKNIKKYDAILNDAFDGIEPVSTLATVEAVKKIHNSLRKDGLYFTNIIGAIQGKYSYFLHAEVNTIKQVFKNVYIIPCSNATNLESLQNFMVIASDKDLKLENSIDLKINKDTLILTDNYVPIESLVKYIYTK